MSLPPGPPLCAQEVYSNKPCRACREAKQRLEDTQTELDDESKAGIERVERAFSKRHCTEGDPACRGYACLRNPACDPLDHDDYSGYLSNGKPKAVIVPIEHIKPTNPKDRAATHRLDLSLVPDTAIAYMALAFTEGDAKYGGYNWREAGVKASIYVAAARRHLAKWVNGEYEDPITLVPHLASVLACIAVIVDADECDKLVDDRPPVAPVDELLGDFEAIVKHLHELYPNGPARHTEAA